MGNSKRVPSLKSLGSEVSMDNDAMCVCGHKAEDHHRSWFRNGGELIEECEFEGYNETGGMMQDLEGKWVEHCQGFRLRILP